uniref:G_PROTEIN_RECEP_F1_2 domain-containing protein n=1 Tax=Steinernema glaseri TaxID=37863 RepID=A0A1I7YWX2_9BILA
MDKPCAQALHFTRAPVVLSFAWLRVVISVVATAATACVLCAEKITRRYHPNARILIRSHFFFNLVASLSFVLVDGADVIRIMFVRTSSTDCRIPLLPGLLAEGLKLPELFCVNALGMSLTCLGLERTFATVYARCYEKHLRTYPGWLLVLVTVLLAALKCYYMIRNAIQEGWSVLATVGQVPPAVQKAGLVMLMVVEVLNIAIFSFLFWLNRQWKREKNRITASLAYKYQVDENLASITNVLQLASVHCATTIVATLFFFILLVLPGSPFITDLLFSIDIYVLYVFILPLVALLKMHQANKRVHTVKRSSQEHRDHFKILDNYFNGDVK